MSKVPWFLPFIELLLYVGMGMLMSYVTHDTCPKEVYIGSALLIYGPVVLLAYYAAKIKQSAKRRSVTGSILALGFVYNVLFVAGFGGSSVMLRFFMYPYFWTYLISATIYFYILNWVASREKANPE